MITNIWESGVNNEGNGTDNNQYYITDNLSSIKRLTIQSGTGNVGINTNIPISILEANVKLDVNGSINLSGNIYKNGVLYVGNSTIWSENYTKTQIYYTSGNVGINNSDPIEVLDINGNIKAINVIANGQGLTNLNASEIKTGTINTDRLPQTIRVANFIGSGEYLYDLNATNIKSGKINNSVLPSTINVLSFKGNGQGLTNLDASKFTSGNINNSRLPANISVSTLTASLSGFGITNLLASNISGNIPNNKLPINISVSSLSGNGLNITNLNASEIKTGKITSSVFLPDNINVQSLSGDGNALSNLDASKISIINKLNNSIFNNDITIAGKLTVGDLEVSGNSTIISTGIYQTENLEIVNNNPDGSSLIINHNSIFNDLMRILSNSTRIFTILKDGNVGIGGTAFPNSNYKLDVEGNINSSGTISSDIVLIKDNINFYKSSTQSVLIKLPQTLTSYTITLPNSGPSANNILKSDSSGILSWVNINDSPTLINVYSFFDDTEFEKTTNIKIKNINSSKLISAFDSSQFVLFGDPQTIKIKDDVLTSGGNVSITSINDPPNFIVNNLNIIETIIITDSTEPTATPSVPKNIPHNKYNYITLTYESAHPNYSSSVVNNQRVHTINFPENVVADILVVGGGGGGGRRHGGGGGAGTLIYHKDIILNGTYTVKVGKGGDGITGGPLYGGQTGRNATNGNNSEFVKQDGTQRYLAVGGGRGSSSGYTNQYANTNGGQGMLTVSSLTLSSGNYFNGNIVQVSNKQYVNTGLTYPEGCRGNVGGFEVNNFKGGGGGGAGSIGMNHGEENTPEDGYGGDGIAIDITGNYVIYAGGGNGSDYNGNVSQVYDPNKPTIELRGGGGYGSDTGTAQNGKNGTGGGGGGQGNDISGTSGFGGSGIVIIRYYKVADAVNDITHKYLILTNEPIKNLIYDFTPYNDFTSWTNYATQIGATYNLNTYMYGGVYYFTSTSTIEQNKGYLELPLHGSYDELKINYENTYTDGVVNIYIDNILKDTCLSNSSKEYFQSYNQNQILKIEEVDGTIGGNLKITFSKSPTIKTYQVNFPINTTCDILAINNSQYIKTSGVTLNGSYSVIVGSTSKIQQNGNDLYVPNNNLSISDSITGSSITYTTNNPIVIIRYKLKEYISVVATTNIIPSGYLKFDNNSWNVEYNSILTSKVLQNEICMTRYLSNNNYSMINIYEYSVINALGVSSSWITINNKDIIYIAKSGYAGSYQNNFVGNILKIRLKYCSLENVYKSFLIDHNSFIHNINCTIKNITSGSILYNSQDIIINNITFFNSPELFTNGINLSTNNIPTNQKHLLELKLFVSFDASTNSTTTIKQQTDKFYLFYEEF